MLEIFLTREDTVNQFLDSRKYSEGETGNQAALKTLLTDFLDFLIDTEKLPEPSVSSVPMVLKTVIEKRSLVPFTVDQVVNLLEGDQSVDRLVMDGQDVIFREKKQLKKMADGTICFGSWPQGENGERAELEWIVPAAEEKRMLLVSKKAIAGRAFDENGKCSWEESDICRWLNNCFYQYAFSDDEKEWISSSESDSVFLLSAQEVNKFISSEEARKAEPTAFAARNGTGVDSQGTSFWWLRSTGVNPGSIACVDPNGCINDTGFNCGNHFIAVRPAMWIMQELPS